MGDGRAVARRAEAAAGPGGAEGRGARVRQGRRRSTATTSATTPRCAGRARAARRSRGTCRGTTRGSNGKDRWVKVEGEDYRIHDGCVVIAAITSCTNTSNPYVMVGAGLVARKARALGLNRKPWVKTSLAPGSQVVQRLPRGRRGCTEDLDALGFNLVGYGCTTCIGNSGPLPEDDLQGDRRRRPRRLLGAVGQPQLRGADQSGRAGELSRLAAAGRRLRARRRHEPRHHHASRSASGGRQAGLPEGHLADASARSPSSSSGR